MNTDHGVSGKRTLPTPQRARRAVAAAALCAAVLAACDDEPHSVQQLGPSRIIQPVGQPIRWNATPAERHGISAKDFGGGAMGGAGGGQPGGGSAGGALSGSEMPGAAMGEASSGLHWTTPAGWTEKPPAMFREANFQVGDEPRAECYLSTLVGEAGGMESNINRWRSQVSLPPMSSAEIAALPRVEWLGGQAVYADFAGRWTGMTGDEGEEGWRLVGLVLVESGRSRFLKMVGPEAAIGSQVEAFRALAASFHEDG